MTTPLTLSTNRHPDGSLVLTADGEIDMSNASQLADALAQARTCYDHLAGRAGVALFDALLQQKVLAGRGTGTDAAYQVT